jgi:hypothetical protein
MCSILNRRYFLMSASSILLGNQATVRPGFFFGHMAHECWDVELAATSQQSAQACVEDAIALEERLPMHAR